MEEDGLQNWRDVLAAHPDAQPGLHNPRRSELLQPGVYFNVSAQRAERWIPLLRQKRATASALAQVEGEASASEREVRITIVEVPEEVQGQSSGTIYVEVDGDRYPIDSSVLAHSIAQPSDTPIFVTPYSAQGFDYEPREGDGSGWSHS